MKRIIRRGMFETNSSSTQSLSFIYKDKKYKIGMGDEKEDIIRYIETRVSKTVVIYQAYYSWSNGYVDERSLNISQLESFSKELEISDLVNTNEYYYLLPIKDLFKVKINPSDLDYNGFIETYNYFVNLINELDERHKKFRKALIDNITDQKEKEWLIKAIELIEKEPTQTGTFTEFFFSNSPLEGYYSDTSFDEVLEFLKIDKFDSNFIDKIIKIINDDSFTFELTEGLMAYDNIPRKF